MEREGLICSFWWNLVVCKLNVSLSTHSYCVKNVKDDKGYYLSV